MYRWFKIVGDVSNCYDELVHSRILTAVKFWLQYIPKHLGRRNCDRFSVNKVNRKEVSCGADTTGGDWVTITVKQILEVCEFDCHNSVLRVRGKVYKRNLGAPMGGFLSAFYAMLTFGYREFVVLAPLLRSLGLPAWCKRYLDDLALCIAYRTLAQLSQIQAFVAKLTGDQAYGYPLVLNVEPEGDQEFLEAKIYSKGTRLWAKLNNKVVADGMQGVAPYRRRLPLAEATNQNDRAKLIAGTIVRIRQIGEANTLLQSLAELKLEAMLAGYGEQDYRRGAMAIVLRGGCSRSETRKLLLSAQLAEAHVVGLCDP